MSIKAMLSMVMLLLTLLMMVTLYSGAKSNYSELRVETLTIARVSLEWVALPSLPSGELCWMLVNTLSSPQYEMPVWCSQNNKP